MASKHHFEIVAEGVDINDLWKAFSTDVLEIGPKADPELMERAHLVEGDRVKLGSIIAIDLGADKTAPGVESFKERVIEMDEEKHSVSYHVFEGGYNNLGFSHFVISIKLDPIEDGKILVGASLTYDLVKDFDGKHLVEEFIKLLRHFVYVVIAYLKKNKA